MKIAVLYGSTMGNTGSAAEQIAQLLGDDVTAKSIGDVGTDVFGEADVLILGSSTWGAGELQDDWYGPLEALKSADLSGKQVAVFGTGDQEMYTDTFVDALRELHDAAVAAGATMVGAVSCDGYEFEESRSVVDDKFVGLALDEDNQAEESAERIRAWVSQIKGELGIS